MGLIPGIEGQKADLYDGAKIDAISERTAGNGVQLQGSTSGVAIEAGEVGEEFKGTWVSISLTANTDTSMGVLTNLPAGIWSVVMCGTGDSANTTDNCQISISSSNNSLDLAQHGETWTYAARLGGNTASQTYYLSRTIRISSPTNIYAVGRNNSGNGSVFRGSIRAVRIA